MNLTRKHLNQVLLSLPHPRLVEQGSIPPNIRIPIYKSDALIKDALLPNYHDSAEIKELTFEYDTKEMDWVLKDLDL